MKGDHRRSRSGVRATSHSGYRKQYPFLAGGRWPVYFCPDQDQPDRNYGGKHEPNLGAHTFQDADYLFRRIAFGLSAYWPETRNGPALPRSWREISPLERGRQVRKVMGTGDWDPEGTAWQKQKVESRKQKWRPETAQASRKPLGCDALAILSGIGILQPSCNYYAAIMQPSCNYYATLEAVGTW
jgi:hypothetical protein